MNVQKSNGNFEEFDNKKLGNIIKKAFKSAKVEVTNEKIKEIIDSLYVYDGILCSSIRKQLEERFKAIDEKVLIAYKTAKEKKDEVKHFVDEKKAFIDNYKKASNTANATIDDNSNVASRNISILSSEAHKPDNIQISRGMIADKLKEIFPDFNAKNYVKDLEHHIIYKNDESSFAGAISPYTYSAKEVVEVLYNGENLLLPLDLLYNIINAPEVLVDSENEVYQKQPWYLFIKDRDNKYTKVTHITKKKRHKDLVRVKTAFGEDIVVTEDHPMIIDNDNIDNTIPASESLGKTQYKIDTEIKFRGKTELDLVKVLPSWIEYGDKYILTPGGGNMKRFIKLNRDFGYIVGFFIGDGGYENTNHYLDLFQKEKDVLEDINNKMFDIFGLTYKITTGKDYHRLDDRDAIKYIYTIRNHYIFELFKNYFKIQDKAQNKTLPINILEFNEEFAKGILEGLIDSDGTIKKDDCSINIRLSSRAGILQCTELFRYFGYAIGNTMQSTPFSNNISYKTNYTIWGINATKRTDSVSLDNSIKVKNNLVNSKSSSLKYHKDGICTVTSVDKIEEESSFLLQNEYIYDLTTETRTFSLNNILVHNCVSITMYPFLTNGIRGIGGLSARPHNIDSFCGMFCNLIFAVSSQYAGAVATSEALLYMCFFAKKEYGDDFWKNPGSFCKIGPKLRNLFNKSHYWTKDVTELAEHDFGSDELNNLRDEIVGESKTPLSKEELEDYVKHIKEDPTYVPRRTSDGSRTILGQLQQYWQQIIYTINQPAAARGFQSAFVNFSYFDKPFFEGMFGEFCFPDGSKPDWESLEWMQQEFMKWFNQERLRTLLTFPVESVTLLFKDGKFVDERMFNFVCEEYARGHSFFTYISSSVDSLSSCCYSKDTKVIIKDARGAYLRTFEEIKSMEFDSNGYKIFNNGKWSSGKLVVLPNRPMYKVTLANNKTMYVTDNHRNNVFGGMKLTKELTTDDYLMVNSTPCDTYSSVDEHLTYEQGFAVGAFLGDGSFGSEIKLSCGESHIYDTNFSLSENKLWIKDILNVASKQCGATKDVKESKSYNNVIPIRISSKEFVAFLMKWTNWTRGTTASNKEVNMNCLLQSIEFRKGIIDGWYATDGNMNSLKSGISLRGYSTSEKLIECLDSICTSLGYITSINVDTRTDGPIFRGVEYKKNYPVYCLLKYAENKHQKIQKDICIFRNNSYYFRIKSIEPVEYTDEVYCFEMNDKTDDLFTLANGIHNFNCRLKNKIQTKEFNFTNGNIGVMTGSKSVISLNLSRIIQDWYCNEYKVERGVKPTEKFDETKYPSLKKYIAKITDRVYKYHMAYNELLWDMYDADLLPVYKAGFIDLNKQYLTIGLNGLNQAAEFLGIQCNDNPEYAKFCQELFGFFKEQNELHKITEGKHKITLNCEQVPAESLAIKNYNWDKEDGYWVPDDTNLYASYVYKPNDQSTSVLEKIRLMGKDYVGDWLDGELSPVIPFRNDHAGIVKLC